MIPSPGEYEHLCLKLMKGSKIEYGRRNLTGRGEHDQWLRNVVLVLKVGIDCLSTESLPRARRIEKLVESNTDRYSFGRVVELLNRIHLILFARFLVESRVSR